MPSKIYNMKSKLILLSLLMLSSISLAQTKVGTINSDYIINIMPEAKVVVAQTQKYGKKLDSSFAIKMNEYKAKVDDYNKREKEMGELEKKTIGKEINGLQEDIRRYQENGNKLMQLKQSELMRPLYKKLNEAIDAVAKANGYTQILTTSGNEFAFIDMKFDITKMVMDKLGIKEPQPQK